MARNINYRNTKDRNVSKDEEEKNQMIFAAGGGIGLLILLIVIYNFYIDSKKQEQKKKQMKFAVGGGIIILIVLISLYIFVVAKKSKPKDRKSGVKVNKTKMDLANAKIKKSIAFGGGTDQLKSQQRREVDAELDKFWKENVSTEKRLKCIVPEMKTETKELCQNLLRSSRQLYDLINQVVKKTIVAEQNHRNIESLRKIMKKLSEQGELTSTGWETIRPYKNSTIVYKEIKQLEDKNDHSRQSNPQSSPVKKEDQVSVLKELSKIERTVPISQNIDLEKASEEETSEDMSMTQFQDMLARKEKMIKNARKQSQEK